MKIVFLSVALLLSLPAFAQLHDVSGGLTDTAGKPVPNAAVSLLDPADSTLAFFGVSNSAGRFEIKSVRDGQYLLQVAGVGYRVLYRPVQIPAAEGDLGYVVLHPAGQSLQEIQVKGTRIPVLLRGDTVEYNAGAFKVKSDAVVEDLLRKLPGVQVDKAGNVRAQGKDVRKVLVDGKEFFGDDPKMATRNLPADAISKVQVFGNKSDATKFTGVDDGTRDQTINIELKESRRRGYFGDAEAGGGTDDHYKVSGKLYRFQPQRQLSALGMLNNINQFGFSFQDYLSFQGGIQSLMSGEGGGMPAGAGGDNMPVNFGQPVTGLITSGAAGVNYSASSPSEDRFTVSYLGNGADKQLSEQSLSRNYTDELAFITSTVQEQQRRDAAHRLDIGWQSGTDSVQQISLRGRASLTDNASRRSQSSVAAQDDVARNMLSSLIREDGSGYNTSLNASYLKKTGNKSWPVWKLTAEGTYARSELNTDQDNRSVIILTDTVLATDRRFQDNQDIRATWKAGTSIVRSLGRGYFLEPSVRAAGDVASLRRRQGAVSPAGEQDSVRAVFSRGWTSLLPGIAFRHNTGRVQLSVGLEAEAGELRPVWEGATLLRGRYSYLKPALFYQNAYASGAQLNGSYSTSVQLPSADQMLPVINTLNPLRRVTGNPRLSPEYMHLFHVGWLRFDQFAGTSLMANVRGTYTSNKVSFQRTIRSDLSEDLSYTNVPGDYGISGGGEYNMPIRPLGLSLTAAIEERYTRGMIVVNDVLSRNGAWNHHLRISIANQKRVKWDVEGGAEADITDARNSLGGVGRTLFYRYNGYARLSWKPSERFNVSLSADVDRYQAPGFPEAVTVPLLSASASCYFLKYRRGVLTLDAFDLLNRNTSVVRVSQLNYLLEQRSNTIRQYLLLSFKYRLNKAGNGKGTADVQVRSR